jgi:bifunctional non-homologous end joining protein LigD
MASKSLAIPSNLDNVILKVQGREVRLTNLRKMFWPERSITKGNLIQYYADVADVLLPHIRDRAMVMRRYPNGAAGSQFFMKEAPTPRPVWIRTCPISHNDDKVVNFPVIDDLAALLWVINLGCIDLNQWYARCDDYNRPDYVHFDLDPSEGTSFERRARVRPDRPRRARVAGHEAVRQDDRVARVARLRADRA